MTTFAKAALIRLPFIVAFIATALIATSLGGPMAGSLENYVVMPSALLGLAMAFTLASEEMVDEMKGGNWTSFRA